MVIDDIPLLGLLRGRLGYLNQRQQVVAENIANADTPGYSARDLKPFSAHIGAARAPAAPTVGQSAIGGLGPGAPNILKTTSSPSRPEPWRPVSAPDSEVTLDGNQVVLEEQMMKMTDARMNYDAAIGFYQKSLQLLRLAARQPGR